MRKIVAYPATAVKNRSYKGDRKSFDSAALRSG
jgi:hypothetical protein